MTRTEQARIKRVLAEFQALRRVQGSCARLVRNALISGRLTRGVCQQCRSKKTVAHHDDYAKPLSVSWFCRRCHQAHHRKLGWGYDGQRKAELIAHLTPAQLPNGKRVKRISTPKQTQLESK
jgi:hypothetical protein